MIFSFKNFIDKNKAVFYHFLDGLLNPNAGYYVNHMQQFIKNNLHINPNIKIIQIDYIIEQNNFCFFIKDSDDKIIIKKEFIFEKINFQSLNLFLFDEEEIQILSNVIQYYCIIQDGTDSHATSIVSFTIDNNFYIMSCNSGKGIDLHEIKDKYYLPYYCYKISDDFETNKKSSIINYLRIVFMRKYYSILNELTKEFKYEKLNINGKEELIVNINILIIFHNELKFLKNFDIFDNNFNIIINTITYNSLSEFINKAINLNNINYHISTNQSAEINITLDYYNLLISLINNKENNNIFYNHTSLQNLNNFDNNIIYDLISSNEKLNNINKIIIDKILLHKINEKLYIYPQESGSCTWFSIYWPILLYYILHDN